MLGSDIMYFGSNLSNVRDWYSAIHIIIIPSVIKIHTKSKPLWPQSGEDCSRDVIDLTYWRLGHFLLHLVCGLLVPDRFTVVFALGCTWEVYEVVMGIEKNNIETKRTEFLPQKIMILSVF